MDAIPGLKDLRVGSIYCIGRNYQKHADEMGSNVPDHPMVFLKPACSIIGNGDAILLPPQSKNVHHEVELVVAIGKKAHKISAGHAKSYLAGYGVGIDVTARDIQQQAKDRGHPWSVAKGFDTFAPISSFAKVRADTDFNSMQIKLQLSGEKRQQGFTKNMIFSVEELVAYLSSIFTLRPGDLIFTGTPEGVSAIQSGDKIRASLNNDEIVLNVAVNRD